MDKLPIEILLKVAELNPFGLCCTCKKYNYILGDANNKTFMINQLQNPIQIPIQIQITYKTAYNIFLKLRYTDTAQWIKHLLQYLPPVRLYRIMHQCTSTIQLKNKVLLLNFMQSWYNLDPEFRETIWISLMDKTQPEWIPTADWTVLQTISDPEIQNPEIQESKNPEIPVQKPRKSRIIKKITSQYNRHDIIGAIYKYIVDRSLQNYINIPHKQNKTTTLDDIKLYLTYRNLVQSQTKTKSN